MSPGVTFSFDSDLKRDVYDCDGHASDFGLPSWNWELYFSIQVEGIIFLNFSVNVKGCFIFREFFLTFLDKLDTSFDVVKFGDKLCNDCIYTGAYSISSVIFRLVC